MIFSTLLSTVLLVFTVKAGDERCDRDKALKRIETSLAIDSMTATKVHVDDIRRGQKAYSRMKDSLAEVSATGLLHDVSHDQAMKRVEQLTEQQLITVEQKDAFAFNRPSIVLGTAAPMLYSSVVMTRMPGAPDRVTLAYTILKLQPSNKRRSTIPSIQFSPVEERHLGFYVKNKAQENFLERNAEAIEEMKKDLEICREAATENPDTK